jgi:N-acetylglutamate synthase-like GNAT family acetyltransferase
MELLGPDLRLESQCEAVLRSLPQWFGIEEALRMYASDTARLPTFALSEDGAVVAFISLMQHFAASWEIHCIAVHADARNRGHGKALLRHSEQWLVSQGVEFLQVKTVAQTSKSVAYAQTRQFYAANGFTPLEVFPLLWAPQNPALQLIKVLKIA